MTRMRTILHNTITSATTTTSTLKTLANMQLLAPQAATVATEVARVGQRSPWHSPVPYLFGGLAAMLGLIAFALMILACSYWRLSRDANQQGNDQSGDLENGGKGDGFSKVNEAHVYEEKIVVIMAGDDKPTFLATPAAIIFSKESSCICKDGPKKCASVGEDDNDNKPKQEENQHHDHEHNNDSS